MTAWICLTPICVSIGSGLTCSHTVRKCWKLRTKENRWNMCLFMAPFFTPQCTERILRIVHMCLWVVTLSRQWQIYTAVVLSNSVIESHTQNCYVCSAQRQWLFNINTQLPGWLRSYCEIVFGCTRQMCSLLKMNPTTESFEWEWGKGRKCNSMLIRCWNMQTGSHFVEIWILKQCMAVVE